MENNTENNNLEVLTGITGMLRCLEVAADKQFPELRPEILPTIKVLDNRIENFEENSKKIDQDTETIIFQDIFSAFLMLYFKINETDVRDIVKNAEHRDREIIWFARLLRNSHAHVLHKDEPHFSFNCKMHCGHALYMIRTKTRNRNLREYCKSGLLGEDKYHQDNLVTHQEIIRRVKNSPQFNHIAIRILEILRKDTEHYMA